MSWPRTGGSLSPDRSAHALLPEQELHLQRDRDARRRGKLSVDNPVLHFFPEEAPAEPSDNWRAMRVRHLLSMSTGHAIDTTAPMTDPAHGSWVRGVLAQPVEYAPGTHFLYNSGATYLLSAIVKAHRRADERLPSAAPVRAAGDRESALGHLAAGDRCGGLGALAHHGRYRRVRPVVPAKGQWQGRL
ncbi:MAG: serine hydrolase domain-containing protein [Thermomicrobiales bacterium]